VAVGKKDRDERLLVRKSGAFASSSVDFVVLVRLLYSASREHAKGIGGNCSPYALCAIPMLLTALRCLMVEYESARPTNEATLEKLTKPNDFLAMLEYYRAPNELMGEARLLCEIRNEIIHPAHLPAGTSDNWPDYLRELKNRGLLQTTGNISADYVFFSQMKSHRLFSWASRVTRDIAKCILESDPAKDWMCEHLESYNRIGFKDDPPT
jgi:hypothetical protein